LFSDEISPKCEKFGEKMDKNVLDPDLASNDEFFWQEVAELQRDFQGISQVLF
jgi:hypothetical protein